MVGIFIALGILIFVVGVLTLGGQQKRFVSSVQVYSFFDEVEGLRSGNNVWFSGVKVGTVKQIQLQQNGKVKVMMNIEEASQPYIRQNSKVRIGSESLIGNRIIEIFDGTADSPPITDGVQLQAESGL
ncbi:MAG: MlaD family protein, partial [Hymenobacteraceae bacterium]|nr:MlaD family protein [Hymenobacteraceae bacterium]MDX5443538.1 MlaD family protein [Hymenobacteraceae bacterium]MDX5512291.1 MlaD family protein [Hymenobacteraceae bacterium]